MDAAALEVLAGTQSALGASKIHHLAQRGSRQGIANALDRLVKQGLVLAEPTNHGFVYRLNREHLLTTAVFAAADVRHELLRRISAECHQLHPEPLSAVLFGSLSRGESTETSDIDLLIVLDQQIEDIDAWTDQLFTLSQKVESWTGNQLQVVTQTRDHLNELLKAREPIIQGWREDGITLFGIDIRTLLGRGPVSKERP